MSVFGEVIEEHLKEMEQWCGSLAVVTGASSGIGAAVSTKLVKIGVNVVGLARRIDRLEELKNSLTNESGKFYAKQCDITKDEDIFSSFEWIIENLGSISILINAAGVLKPTTLKDGTTEIWKEAFDVNVLGLCICTRQALKSMKANAIAGHIVHVSCLAGHIVPEIPSQEPRLNVYPATKHAVRAITETLRKELLRIDSKIKVSSVSPGITMSDMYSEFPNDTIQTLSDVPRLTPEDVANAIIYILATPPGVQYIYFFNLKIDFKLDVDRSFRDELEYELQFRRIDYSGNVEKLRKRLRIALALKKSGNRIIHLDAQTEIKICKRKLNEFTTKSSTWPIRKIQYINTTTELTSYCRRLEETKLKVKEFKPFPEGRLTLDPDLDYYFINAKPKVNPLLIKTQLQQQRTPRTIKLCHRCHKPGHLAKMYQILAQVNDSKCPYVNVNIVNKKIYGLLDSGANKTFINEINMVNNNQTLPEPPDNMEESFTTNHGEIVMPTDSDSEEEVPFDGYEPLPLDAPDEVNESSDSENDSGLDSVSHASSQENLPPITRIENTLVKEVWSTPSTVDITMDSIKVNEVKEAMANIKLPLSAIPEWANNIPEDEWKQHLYNRLQSLQKKTT
ncbi:hypothetical protein RN001_002575 [Aquatica leii]|uniref:Uncharacterized protein n=1 Tax=Aquatica leii TaxID=1421715 RepID=A0AAN7SLW4_9COLE|nr:hypothetical protein RN001_002575 [Aquatica leii]